MILILTYFIKFLLVAILLIIQYYNNLYKEPLIIC